MNYPLNQQRRCVLAGIAAASASVFSRPAQAAAAKPLTKPIVSSGESIPVIGMGTWITFNVGKDKDLRAQRADVLRAFFAAGGSLIDSSPMYGSAQEVLGDLLTPLAPRQLFSATKVWTGSDGREQIAQAHQLWQRSRFDLLQVHNLLNWQSHLPLLREMKEAGSIRYLGITTSHGRRHADLAQIMRTEPLDFVQFTYNPVDREAEKILLPLALDKGIAVIVNRPFQRGSLTSQLKDIKLPAIAADLACQTWAELLLKFSISHPAVTCAIPATSRVDHMQQNMRAATGPMPNTRQRELIAQAVARR